MSAFAPEPPVIVDGVVLFAVLLVWTTAGYAFARAALIIAGRRSS